MSVDEVRHSKKGDKPGTGRKLNESPSRVVPEPHARDSPSIRSPTVMVHSSTCDCRAEPNS